jgi:hypothetical protein
MSQPNNPGSGDIDLSSNAVSGASLQVVGGQGTLGQSASYTPNANTTVVGSSVISLSFTYPTTGIARLLRGSALHQLFCLPTAIRR